MIWRFLARWIDNDVFDRHLLSKSPHAIKMKQIDLKTLLRYFTTFHSSFQDKFEINPEQQMKKLNKFILFAPFPQNLMKISSSGGHSIEEYRIQQSILFTSSFFPHDFLLISNYFKCAQPKVRLFNNFSDSLLMISKII